MSNVVRPRDGVAKVAMVERCEADRALVKVGESDRRGFGEDVTERSCEAGLLRPPAMRNP